MLPGSSAAARRASSAWPGWRPPITRNRRSPQQHRRLVPGSTTRSTGSCRVSCLGRGSGLIRRRTAEPTMPRARHPGANQVARAIEVETAPLHVDDESCRRPGRRDRATIASARATRSRRRRRAAGPAGDDIRCQGDMGPLAAPQRGRSPIAAGASLEEPAFGPRQAEILAQGPPSYSRRKMPRRCNSGTTLSTKSSSPPGR